MGVEPVVRAHGIQHLVEGLGAEFEGDGRDSRL